MLFRHITRSVDSHGDQPPGCCSFWINSGVPSDAGSGVCCEFKCVITSDKDETKVVTAMSFTMVVAIVL